MVHETDEPDALGHFPDANVLTGDDLTAIDFATADAQSAALRDGDSTVVEWITRATQPVVGQPKGGDTVPIARPYAHPYFWAGFIHTGL